jgi:hypothetical protein
MAASSVATQDDSDIGMSFAVPTASFVRVAVLTTLLMKLGHPVAIIGSGGTLAAYAGSADTPRVRL